MTLEQAFAQSINTAAVRLATTVGLDKVVAAARELGTGRPAVAKVPSIALGTSEVTPARSDWRLRFGAGGPCET